MNADELQSKTIAWLRFPMIIGVLLIHSYKPPINHGGMLLGNEHIVYPMFQFFRNLGSEVVGRLSVPMFFLIAGFLFFQAVRFDRQFYFKKLKSRFHSLLVPYLFWISLTIVVYTLLQRVFGITDLAYGAVPPMSQWGVVDYLRSFWNLRSPSYPLIYPLWFIRDLMVTILLSPLLYGLMKHLGLAAILLFFLFWMFGFPIHLTGVNITALFFFMLGGYLRISRKNLVTECRKLFRFSLIAYPIVAVADACTKGLVINAHLHHVGILLGILFLFNTVSSLLQHRKLTVGGFLPGASFFLFAFHEQSLSQVRKSLTGLFPPGSSQANDVILYLLPMLIIIPVALGIYYLLKKYFPFVLRFAVGAR